MEADGENARTWWVLYPLVGLDITDTTDDLDEQTPLFIDATILSPRHVESYSDKLSLAEAVSRFMRDSVRKTLGNVEPYSSFIAVRGIGDARQNSQDRDRISQETSERAYQIAALLNLTILAHWLSRQTVALVAQLHRGTNNRVWINRETGQHRLILAHMSSFAALGPDGLKWTRDEIRELLYQRQFAQFTQAFNINDQLYEEELPRIIRRAAVRLADAVHTIDPASRLLGAVTSLEILVGAQPKYQLMTNRLFALLGRDLYEQFKTAEVVTARHNYVHQGHKLTDVDIADDAIYLALASILRFSTLAPAFQSEQHAKSELRKYLDSVEVGMKRWAQLSSDQRAAFTEQLKHDVDAPIFPYEYKADEHV